VSFCLHQAASCYSFIKSVSTKNHRFSPDVPEEGLWKLTPTSKRVSALCIEPGRFIVGEILSLSDDEVP